MNALSLPVVLPTPAHAFLDFADSGSHLILCNRQRGAWFSWKCQAASAHAFFSSRIITCALAAVLLIYLAVKWLG